MRTKFSPFFRGLALWLVVLMAFFAMAPQGAKATVTVGAKVTSESSLSSSRVYIIYEPRNACYIQEPSSGTYANKYYCPEENSVTDESFLFQFIPNGNGTYKIKNYSTGNYMPAPSAVGILGSTTEANAGSWDLQFDETNAAIFPICNGYGWNRGSSQLWATTGVTTTYNAWTAGTKSTAINVYEYVIYEVEVTSLNLSFTRADAGSGTATNNVSDVTVNVKDDAGNAILGVTATLASTSITQLKTGSAAALSRTDNAVLAPNAGYANQQNSQITYTFQVNGLPSSFAYNTADLDVYALNGSGAAQGNSGSTVRQWTMNVATGSASGSETTLVESTGNDICTVSDASGGLYHKVWTVGSSDTEVAATDPLFIKVTLTKTDANGCYAGLGAVKLYMEEGEEGFAPTGSEVYTINNTNSYRGAITYDPAKSTKYVWSSGKSGATAFDATNANHQWIIYPTGTADQYYLYNVGAKKFAVPTTGGSYDGVCWMFSDDAAPVSFTEQSDGTYQIFAPYGSRYMSVSNNYVGPIINYTNGNDPGQFFTINKVGEASSDVTAAVKTAVGRLVGQRTSTKLTATSDFTTAGGWYVIKVNSGDWGGHSLRCEENEITYNSKNYPVGFYGYGYEDASIANGQRLFRITRSGSGYTWQMPNGKYLYNPEQTFPVSTPDETVISIGKTSAGFSLYHQSAATYTRYATALYQSGQHFVGETSTATNIFDIYPADLTAAGLEAWQIKCDLAGENTKIACTRSDVSGLSEVYKNGYIFLPAGVTPASTDFVLAGASNVVVNATAKTVTISYDPTTAITTDQISVSQGWQTAGRDDKVYLLRVNASPFQAATSVSLAVSLKNGTENQISSLTLYEANSTSPEVLGTGSGTPTLTQVATTAIDGSSASATLSIGNFAAGDHYYWLAAQVKSDATLGSILDAAVTNITYTCSSTETILDLTSIGDPSDRGAMVFNTRSYPFLPWDNGSHIYRIPAMVVANDGSIVVACDKRYSRYDDIGNNHVIDIVIRRSTDGGKTWSTPVVVAKGDNSTAATTGYGDPSLYKDNNGKLYCLFAAGNTGYFNGLNRICMSTSTDNGVTWSSSDATPPADLVSTGKVTDHANAYGSNTAYGLYDFFVTSGRGICTSEGYLMALLPAQPYTDSGKPAHTSNSQDYIFYSTDQGDTWHISENAIYTGGDEAKVTQLEDGKILASVRQAQGRGFNTATYTANGDGTLSFTMGTQSQNTQLHNGNNANNQDILYYQRSASTGKTDVIFHSMTTGTHANMKLYYSLDKGANWTEFLNVQTKGTRYVTMDRGGSDANPGSLYVLFEDQSLNATGGYTDYNHYPLNFLEITREQLEALIPTLNDAYVANPTNDVKVVDGTTGEASYGSWSNLVWTSNASSGMAGVTMTLSDGSHDKFSTFNSRYNLLYHPAAANTDATITLTAPAGYAITSYTAQAGVYDGTAYTLTKSDGTTITPPNVKDSNTYADLSMTGLTSQSEVITVRTTDASKWLSLANFTVSLRRAVTYNVVDGSGNVRASQLVVFKTLNVADEMPDALKSAGYVNAFYSDAECTTPISEIGDETVNIYVRKYTFDAVKRYTLKDDRNNRYVAMTASGYAKASNYLHPDCTWTISSRGDGSFDLVANDGSYLSTVPDGTSLKTTASAPESGWEITQSDVDGYVWITLGTSVGLHMPNGSHNDNVMNWGPKNSGTDGAGCRFLIAEAPDMFQVSDDTNEYWYNITTHKAGTPYYVDLGPVGRAVYGNVASEPDNMEQQWMVKRRNDGGYNLVCRQDRSMFNIAMGNKEASGGYGGYGTSDEEPASALWLNYQSSSDSYTITNGSFQMHQSNIGRYGDGYVLMNYGSGTNTDQDCLFALSAAPAPTDKLATGWYRMKVHKNIERTGVVAENELYGRYLYNNEVWTQVNDPGSSSSLSGFFPISVQTAAAQPDDDDATYYIYVNKDASGNVQLRSTNGHWLGQWGVANYNAPLLQLSNYDATSAVTNLLTTFDGDGYQFTATTPLSFIVSNYGTEHTSTYTDALGDTHTAAANYFGSASYTGSTDGDERLLLRPIELTAVGLTSYEVLSYAYPEYDDHGVANMEATYSYGNSFQHEAPHVTVTNSDLASDVTDYYKGGTVFVKNATIVESNLDCPNLTNYWYAHENLTATEAQVAPTVKVVPSVMNNPYYIALVNAYIPQVKANAVAAINGVGPGYPHSWHLARTVLASIGTASQISAKDYKEFTAKNLQDMMNGAEALFAETDVELPADGKSFEFWNAPVDGEYSLQSEFGLPLLLPLTNLDYTTADPDDVDNPAVSGWKTFVYGANVNKADNESGKIDTQYILPTAWNYLPNYVLPVNGFVIGRHLEDDKYAFVNINGDYLAFDNADMKATYDAQVHAIRVRKLSVSDLASNGANKTPKQLYGKVYLSGYSSAYGEERVITVKDALNTTDYSLPVSTAYAQPMFDKVAGESYSSAFGFAWNPGFQSYFTGDYLSEHVTFNAAGDTNYATLYLPFPVELPTNCEAYVFDELEEGHPVLEEGNAHKTRTLVTHTITGVLPARTAALLKFDGYNSSSKPTFVPALTTGKESMDDAVKEAAENGWLHGLLAPYPTTEIAERYSVTTDDIYAFNKQNDVVGFYHYSGANLKAGRVFLIYPGDPSEDIRAFLFTTDDGSTTSIGDLLDTLNGIDPDADKTIYDLQGRRVVNPVKGNVYVVGGKKVLMK